VVDVAWNCCDLLPIGRDNFPVVQAVEDAAALIDSYVQDGSCNSRHRKVGTPASIGVPRDSKDDWPSRPPLNGHNHGIEAFSSRSQPTDRPTDRPIDRPMPKRPTDIPIIGNRPIERPMTDPLLMERDRGNRSATDRNPPHNRPPHDRSPLDRPHLNRVQIDHSLQDRDRFPMDRGVANPDYRYSELPPPHLDLPHSSMDHSSIPSHSRDRDPGHARASHPDDRRPSSYPAHGERQPPASAAAKGDRYGGAFIDPTTQQNTSLSMPPVKESRYVTSSESSTRPRRDNNDQPASTASTHPTSYANARGAQYPDERRGAAVAAPASSANGQSDKGIVQALQALLSNLGSSSAIVPTATHADAATMHSTQHSYTSLPSAPSVPLTISPHSNVTTPPSYAINHDGYQTASYFDSQSQFGMPPAIPPYAQTTSHSAYPTPLYGVGFTPSSYAQSAYTNPPSAYAQPSTAFAQSEFGNPQSSAYAPPAPSPYAQPSPYTTNPTLPHQMQSYPRY
jgi:hypothetical protein